MAWEFGVKREKDEGGGRHVVVVIQDEDALREKETLASREK